MKKSDFKPGKVYKFRHRTKGRFYGRVKQVLPGDDHDPFLIEVEIDTRKRTDQERLRTSGDLRLSALRPSKIESFQLATDDAFDRKLYVEKEPEPEGFFKMLTKKVGRKRR